MDDAPSTQNFITQDTLHRELARTQAEAGRLKASIRVLQLMVGALLVTSAALAVGVFQLSGRILDTTAEVNGLRGSMQGMFDDNLPVVRELQSSLEEANREAGDLHQAMANGGQFASQMDEAIARANEEMPRNFEAFFKERGPILLKDAIEDPMVTEAGREQTKTFLLQALDDPSIETKMKDKMGSALDDALRGMTLGGSSSRSEKE